MVRVLEESAVATSATDTCQGTRFFLAARRCGIARPVWGTPLSPEPSLSEALLPCLIRLVRLRKRSIRTAQQKLSMHSHLPLPCLTKHGNTNSCMPYVGKPPTLFLPEKRQMDRDALGRDCFPTPTRPRPWPASSQMRHHPRKSRHNI